MVNGGPERRFSKGDEGMSRREFLRRTAEAASVVISQGIIGSFLGPLAWEWGQDKWNKEELEREIESLQKTIQKEYGVKAGVSFRDFPKEGTLQGTKEFTAEIASRYIRYKSLKELLHLLHVYPPQLIRTHVREIRLADGFWIEDHTTERAVGVADYEKRLIIADIRPFFQVHAALFDSAVVPQRTMHHEIAHLVCEKIDEQTWKSLHPGVRYIWLFADTLPAEKVPPGFVQAHGMRSPEEDIATVAQAVFLPDRYARMFARDSILRRKAEYIKTWYQKESQGLMGPQYWHDLANGEVGDDYWKKYFR